MTSPKLKLHTNEKIVVLPVRRSPKGFKYAITNYGRAISFTDEPETGRFLKLGLVSGYPALAIRKGHEPKTFLMHRLMAEHFLKRPDAKHKFVMHLNHKKDDNFVQNLKWATFEQHQKHMLVNRRANRIGNYKLTAERVALIKKRLATGKSRLKTIAKQFGVTDMQIHRIKTGENWGYVKV